MVGGCRLRPPKLRNGSDPATHGDVDAVCEALFAAGVDGLFSDFPALAVKARGQARSSRRFPGRRIEEARVADLGGVLGQLDVDPGDHVAKRPVPERPACPPRRREIVRAHLR